MRQKIRREWAVSVMALTAFNLNSLACLKSFEAAFLAKVHAHRVL
jgi:hypothetical protein